MATLSEQEREALEVALDGGRMYDDVPRAVEAILTARLERVEALIPMADPELIEAGYPIDSRDLLAALASDPTHAQDGGA
jgi:hypothetical protein